MSRLPRLHRRALVGAGAVGLLLLGCSPSSRDLHVCGEDTHRETRVRFSVDERWCARESQERHGLYTAWHVTDGEGKRIEGRFRDDRRSGIWRRWDDTAALRWQGDYVDGARDGLWSYRHPNGERWTSGAFRSGVRVGRWTFWDRHGEVTARVDCSVCLVGVEKSSKKGTFRATAKSVS